MAPAAPGLPEGPGGAAEVRAGGLWRGCCRLRRGRGSISGPSCRKAASIASHARPSRKRKSQARFGGVAEIKTASRSSKCRLSTPPDRPSSSLNLTHSSVPCLRLLGWQHAPGCARISQWLGRGGRRARGWALAAHVHGLCLLHPFGRPIAVHTG
jgi:hypothetical protein